MESPRLSSFENTDGYAWSGFRPSVLFAPCWCRYALVQALIWCLNAMEAQPRDPICPCRTDLLLLTVNPFICISHSCKSSPGSIFPYSLARVLLSSISFLICIFAPSGIAVFAVVTPWNINRGAIKPKPSRALSPHCAQFSSNH